MMPHPTEITSPTMTPMRVVVTPDGVTCRIVLPRDATRSRAYASRRRSRQAAALRPYFDSAVAAGAHTAALAPPWIESWPLLARHTLELLAPILLILAGPGLIASSRPPGVSGPAHIPDASRVPVEAALLPAPRTPVSSTESPQPSLTEARVSTRASGQAVSVESSPVSSTEPASTTPAAIRPLWRYEPTLSGTGLRMSQPLAPANPKLEAPGGLRFSWAESYGTRATGSPSILLEPTGRRSRTSGMASSDTLWLARAIYSESNRRQEQELVAWVVRNRVETAYQGRTTYRDIVLAPYQFSAFNAGNPKRAEFMTLDAHSDEPGWAQALEIARRVYRAPSSARPFPISTRHFYSEQSLLEDAPPAWAQADRQASLTSRNIEAARFQFYDGVL